MDEFQLLLDENFNYFEWELKQNLRPTDEDFSISKPKEELLPDEVSSLIFLTPSQSQCSYHDVEGVQCKESPYRQTLCRYHFERKCSLWNCLNLKVKRELCHFHDRILCKFKNCRRAKAKYNLCLCHSKEKCITLGCYNFKFDQNKCRTCLGLK